MVLIISQKSDVSTDSVMDWLFYKKIKCFRVNGDTIFNMNSFATFEISFHENTSKILFNENNPIDLNKRFSIWHRRDMAPSLPKLHEIKNQKLNADILTHLSIENSEAKKALFSFLKNGKKTLGNFEKSSINKIEVLKLASDNNIDIPATIITSSKSDLQKFKKRHDRVITKTLKDCFHFIHEDKNNKDVFLNYTEEVSEEFIQKMSSTFFSSLFQEKLDKELDIRTFFLDGKCYSMAIFSQLNSIVAIDVRKNNKIKKNRSVPYQLPKLLEKKIETLMRTLELNTGSLDFIKTKQGRFVFLEVNPVGQYGMTSYPCNYHLDKKIAEYLMH